RAAPPAERSPAPPLQADSACSKRCPLCLAVGPCEPLAAWLRHDHQPGIQIQRGIERQEPVEHLAEELDVTLAGKAGAVQRYFDFHAAQQAAPDELLQGPVPHVRDGVNAPAVHLAFRPVVEGETAA